MVILYWLNHKPTEQLKLEKYRIISWFKKKKGGLVDTTGHIVEDERWRDDFLCHEHAC